MTQTPDRRPVAPNYHIGRPRPSGRLWGGVGAALLIEAVVIAAVVWVVFALLALGQP